MSEASTVDVDGAGAPEGGKHHWFGRRRGEHRDEVHAAAADAVHIDAPPAAPPLRVLSIDGGGIRGIIPAMLLAELERRTGKPSCELFDLVAGTSTGGIIALGLACPDADGRPAFSAEDGIRIYEEQGGKIFAKSKRQSLHSLGALLHEKYTATGLEHTLADAYGDAMLSDALVPVLVCAYELGNRETYLFSSRRAAEDPSHDFPMRVAARATSAAPTFFEPAFVTDPDGKDHVFIDGAVFANNPAMCAFAEVEAHHKGADLAIVSVGAGSLTQSFGREVKEWGAAQWARPILNIVLDGASQSTDSQLQELLGPSRYFRFQVELTRSCNDLDDASAGNIAELKRLAKAMISAQSERLDKICELLLR